MISFANATGNLFNRIAKAGLIVKQNLSSQSSQKTNYTSTSTGLVAQLNADPDIQALVGAGYIGALAGSESDCALAASVARAALDRAVFLDNPRINQTLTQSNIPDSLVEVIRQMKQAGATVLAMTIGATPTAFTGTGNGVVVASTKRPLDGLVMENSFAETLLLTCTQDSYTGGVTAGNEIFALTGAGSQGDVFAFNWPLGSNANVNLSAINGAADNTSGNLLTNSGFDTFTVANTPDKWTIVTGTAGTNIFSESSLVFAGAKALRLLGDGTTLIDIKQQFNNAAGTTGALSPITQYGVALWMRRDGVAAGAGQIVVDLIDGNNAVINDQNGVPNTFTIDLTALGTAYTAYTAAFRTPEVLPAQQYLRIRMTTALSNGRSVYLDQLSFGVMTQAYTGGPFASVHAGSVNFAQNDYATIAVTNSRGAGGTLSTFQTLLFQFFPEIAQSELLFPSSASPSISDSLIA